LRGGKFLYEMLPYLFPEGFLTETEIMLHEMYYMSKAEQLKKK
jgi:hypothetical protein